MSSYRSPIKHIRLKLQQQQQHHNSIAKKHEHDSSRVHVVKETTVSSRTPGIGKAEQDAGCNSSNSAADDVTAGSTELCATSQVPAKSGPLSSSQLLFADRLWISQADHTNTVSVDEVDETSRDECSEEAISKPEYAHQLKDCSDDPDNNNNNNDKMRSNAPSQQLTDSLVKRDQGLSGNHRSSWRGFAEHNCHSSQFSLVSAVTSSLRTIDPLRDTVGWIRGKTRRKETSPLKGNVDRGSVTQSSDKIKTSDYKQPRPGDHVETLLSQKCQNDITNNNNNNNNNKVEKELYSRDEYNELLHQHLTWSPFNRGLSGLEELCRLPNGIAQDEWIASHVCAFFANVNLLYSTIREYCTLTSCPHLNGYHTQLSSWTDEKGRKFKCTAVQHMDLAMGYVDKVMNSGYDDHAVTGSTTSGAGSGSSAFGGSLKWNEIGTSTGQAIGSNNSCAVGGVSGSSTAGCLTCSSSLSGSTPSKTFIATANQEVTDRVMRAMLKVLCHIYQAHFRHIVDFHMNRHLNSVFLHFMTFGIHFKILDAKDTELLHGLFHVLLARATRGITNNNNNNNVEKSVNCDVPAGSMATGKGGVASNTLSS